MKKLILITIIVFCLFIGISIFISTCCFFPSLIVNCQIDCLLNENGVIIGYPYRVFTGLDQNDWIFQRNNPSQNEPSWKRYLPIVMTNNGRKKTQINWSSNISHAWCSSDSFVSLESLDPLTNEVLSRICIESEYDLNKNASLCICIPPHLLVFSDEEPENIPYRGHSQQSAKGDYNQTWTNLVFLENYSNDPMAWEKRTFDYYPPGDAHLLCWEYSPDYQGCFLLFEIYPKECNELIYYHVAKQEVTAKVQIQGYREGFQVFSILNDKKHIMVYNENKIEFYSLPDLKLVKTVAHSGLKLDTL